MCNLTHPVPDTSAQPDPAGYGDYSGSTPPSAPPSTATKMAPTKLGKLLKVVAPLVQGGAVGAFGGNPQEPGSGFAASERYFAQQTEQKQRQQQLQQEAADKYYLDLYRQSEARRIDEQANRPRFQPGAATKIQVGGKTYWAQRNPDTGELESTGMEAPPEKTELQPVTTDQGIMSFEKSGPEPGKVTQLRMPGVATKDTGGVRIPFSLDAPENTASAAPGGGYQVTENGKVVAQFDTKEEADQYINEHQVHAPLGQGNKTPFQAPGGQPVEGVPLGPPKKAAARPIIRTERDAQGVERDYEYDNSGKKLSNTPIATRQPRPRAPAKPSAKDVAAKTAGDIEQLAQALLNGRKGDADAAIADADKMTTLAPEKKAALRARIREMKRPGQATKKKSIFDIPGVTPEAAKQALSTVGR